MKVLVVSHACVLPVNQEVYLELHRRGCDVTLVVPNRWKHAYTPKPFPPTVHRDFTGVVHRLPIALPGKPQRHLYRTGISGVLRRAAPDVVVIEEEAFSAAGSQWASAARRAAIPYGLQFAENLPHRVPGWARPVARRNLRHASFVFARSPAAASLAESLGAAVPADVWPHVVPSWSTADALTARRGSADTPTIGYAGRLVPEKGIDVLLAAHSLMPGVRLRIAGDGPLRHLVEEHARGGADVHLDVPRHDEMPDFYRQIDLLVLPSRTTPTWSEQFGRVLVEAMWFGVPVVAADSGEIPWVVSTTGGGLLVREGDVGELVSTVLGLMADGPGRQLLADRGRASVQREFSAAGGASALQDILNRVVAKR